MNIHINYDFVNDKIELFFIEEGEYGTRYVAEQLQLVFKKVEPGAKTPPTLSFEGHKWTEFGQAFLEALEKAGFTAMSTKLQKEKGLKDEATLVATKYHLEDMRKLVFSPEPLVTNLSAKEVGYA